jgi:Domain of unknown function (DUF1850)
MKLMLAAVLGSLALVGGSPHVVARGADGEIVADLRLAEPAFALEYRHSYYRVPARESFRVRDDGSFELAAVSSPSEAVLDYYEIEGTRDRRGGWWTLRPARPARFETMALAATATGLRTLVAGDRRVALWREAVHLRLAVEQ